MELFAILAQQLCTKLVKRSLLRIQQRTYQWNPTQRNVATNNDNLFTLILTLTLTDKIELL